MVSRVAPDEQKAIDEAWDNLFTPPRRTDRLLLLDAVVLHQLHQSGVDRLEMISEKRVRDGRVVMRVHFDREHPERDEFTITLSDHRGRPQRRERDPRNDVDGRVQFLFDAQFEFRTFLRPRELPH